MKEKILVAMSGGVDSSAAALLLLKSGYDVCGITLRLYDSGNIPLGELQSERDAKAVCNTLGIPFFVADYRKEFYDCVIGEFISAYERGETPNPCVICNRRVKLEFMLREADRLGIEKIATGHYAKIEKFGERFAVRRGADEKKDQSYMLSLLTQEQLSRTLLPLGGMTKEEIRELAKNASLPVAHKKDSQDICFIPDGDYAAFIESVTKKAYPAGDFMDTEGNILGRHRGIIRYTTGQRKGLGLALPAPMYVLYKDVASNTVVLGSSGQLFTSECSVCDTNFLPFEALTSPLRASVKVRYSHSAAAATLFPADNGCVKVVFDEPQRAITCGQTAAFYDGDILLGGGKIL